MLVSLEKRRIASYSVCHMFKCRHAVVDIDCFLICMKQWVKVGPTNHHQRRVRLGDNAVILCVVLHLLSRCRGSNTFSRRTSIATVNSSANWLITSVKLLPVLIGSGRKNSCVSWPLPTRSPRSMVNVKDSSDTVHSGFPSCRQWRFVFR